MNLKMWGRALRIIPSVSREEWSALDFVSKWLIASRAAVLVMTLISAALAGLFAARDGVFQVLPWLALAFGLAFAHATNNIFNDYTDFVRGVDKDNYFRTLYGPQALAAGFLTKKQSLAMAGMTGLLALAFGLALIAWRGWDPRMFFLLGLGVFFVLAYTWPLKHIALGEVVVLLVWGPLMIGGGYYALAGAWDWNVVMAGLPYALGVTTVIFGKHIDKIDVDRAKGIHTLPVLIGEKTARWSVIAMMIVPYPLVAYLIVVKYFSPAMALVLLALPASVRAIKRFLSPRPSERPDWFPDGNGGWPLYFAPIGFVNNRSFGLWFLLGLLIDLALRLIPATSSFWR